MKDRIKRIIESQHMTQQEFAENIKIAPATLSSIFTGRTAPSLKIVDAIKSRFPDISTDWLLFGRGAMTDYRNSEAGAMLNSNTTPPTNSALDFDSTPETAGSISDTINSNIDNHPRIETSATETPETSGPKKLRQKRTSYRRDKNILRRPDMGDLRTEEYVKDSFVLSSVCTIS